MIARAPFGRTGHESPRTLFGAAALSRASQEAADQALETLMRYGVDHIDTAASYGDSELRIAPWLARHGRDRFFVATKTGKRTYAEARDEIRLSLSRLGTDHLDLIQLHTLADPIEWDQALSPGGALEAALEAREQGLVRFIGVTGHGAQIAATHRRSLERFDFDSVLLPYNYTTMQNEYYAANFDALAQTCRERNVAVQTIKSIARGPWWGQEHTAATWYEPLRDQHDIDLAVHWALSRPGIFLNTAGDIALLPLVLDAASRFQQPLSDQQMGELAARLEMKPLFV